MRKIFACQNLSHRDYEVTPNIRSTTKKAMTIFPMRISRNMCLAYFQVSLLKVSSPQRVFLLVPFQHQQEFFLSEFSIVWNYFLCVYLFIVSVDLALWRKDNAFFIYHSPLCTSTNSTTTKNSNNILVLKLALCTSIFT